jgi:pyruvate formate lyase activating enzyme
MATPLAFLDRLQEKGIATTLRQVIIPTQSDDEENIRRFAAIARAHSVVDKIELLPFRKLCTVKYDSLGIPFAFANVPEPTRETMQRLEQLLNQ